MNCADAYNGRKQETIHRAEYVLFEFAIFLKLLAKRTGFENRSLL